MTAQARNRLEMAGIVLLVSMAVAATLLLPPGCAHTSYDSATQAITAAERLQTATMQSLEKFDGQHQADIVAAAPSRADGVAALLAYRAKRSIVQTAVLHLAALTTVARSALALVEDGAKDKNTLDKALADMGSAGVELSGLLSDFDIAGVK